MSPLLRLKLPNHKCLKENPKHSPLKGKLQPNFPTLNFFKTIIIPHILIRRMAPFLCLCPHCTFQSLPYGPFFLMFVTPMYLSLRLCLDLGHGEGFVDGEENVGEIPSNIECMFPSPFLSTQQVLYRSKHSLHIIFLIIIDLSVLSSDYLSQTRFHKAFLVYVRVLVCMCFAIDLWRGKKEKKH